MPILRSILGPILRPITQAVTDLAGGGGFSPASLFASGEQGAWYDPSDFSTMWQDAAGTAQVTAAGQPIGLILDKRLGIARGAELMVNGDFSANIAGWSSVTPAQALATWDTGRLKLANVSGVAAGAQTALYVLPTTAGKWYQLNATIDANIAARIRTQGSNAPTYFLPTPGVFAASLIFLATGATTNIEFDLADSGQWYGAGSIAYLDNISVREVVGNHAAQFTSGFRPLLQAAPLRVDYDGVDDLLATTFPNLGSAVTIARGVPGSGAAFLTGQTIGAGVRNDSADYCGLIIINRALTAPETASVTAYLNAKSF